MTESQPADPGISIGQILSVERIDVGCRISSKKRLMEHMASLLARESPVNQQTVFKVLIDRERLGSTGIGNGVALPHGRLGNITEPLLAVAVLEHSLDYQAPDQQQVHLVAALVVPENANETHLSVLAQLARLFNQKGLCRQLTRARTKEAVYDILIEGSAA